MCGPFCNTIVFDTHMSIITMLNSLDANTEQNAIMMVRGGDTSPRVLHNIIR